MQTALQLSDLEPVSVERHHVGGLVLIVIPLEVLLQPGEHIISIMVVQHALIHVRTVTSLVALDVVSIQRDFPNTWERLGWAGSTLALVWDLVVQGVRPQWNWAWWNADRTVVDESEVLDDLELEEYRINHLKPQQTKLNQTLYCVLRPGFRKGARIPLISFVDTLEKCFRIDRIPIISPTHSS